MEPPAGRWRQRLGRRLRARTVAARNGRVPRRALAAGSWAWRRAPIASCSRACCWSSSALRRGLRGGAAQVDDQARIGAEVVTSIRVGVVLLLALRTQDLSVLGDTLGGGAFRRLGRRVAARRASRPSRGRRGSDADTVHTAVVSSFGAWSDKPLAASCSPRSCSSRSPRWWRASAGPRSPPGRSAPGAGRVGGQRRRGRVAAPRGDQHRVAARVAPPNTPDVSGVGGADPARHDRARGPGVPRRYANAPPTLTEPRQIAALRRRLGGRDSVDHTICGSSAHLLLWLVLRLLILRRRAQHSGYAPDCCRSDRG